MHPTTEKLLRLILNPECADNEALAAVKRLRLLVGAQGGFERLLQRQPPPPAERVHDRQERSEMIKRCEILHKAIFKIFNNPRHNELLSLITPRTQESRDGGRRPLPAKSCR